MHLSLAAAVVFLCTAMYCTCIPVPETANYLAVIDHYNY